MLIEFNIRKNFFDDLEKKIYGIEPNNDCDGNEANEANEENEANEANEANEIIYNFIPIKILGEYYILTSLKKLEGYLMDYKNFKAKIYIGHKTYTIDIKNVVSFTEKDYRANEQYDCYIDSVCNLLLIKFKSQELEYILIDSMMDIKNDIYYDNEFIKLTYKWTGDDFINQRTYSKITNIKYLWDEKYLNLPPIPYIIDSSNINNKLVPITGSGVFQLDKLVGMVSYVTNYEIIITPLICIKKLAKYLEGDYIFSLGIDVFPINLNFKSEINKIEYTNGLIIGNNFYDSSVLKKSKAIKKNMDEQYKNDKKIKNDTELNISKKKFSNTNTNLINFTDEINSIIDEKIIKYTIDEDTSFSDIKTENKKDNIKKNLINDTKNLIDDTKKSFYKQIIEASICNKIFKRMTILCTVDKFKINEKGNLLIDKKDIFIDKKDISIEGKNMLFEYDITKDMIDDSTNTKQIPFKSYIWLFKSIDDNNLEIIYIPNNLHKINPIILGRINAEIKDSDVPKYINLSSTNILLNSNFNDISSIGINEISYIRLKNIYFFELNEKILFMLKKIISMRPNLYVDVFEKIFSHRYTHIGSKILIIINLKKYPRIKIINGYFNFDSVIKKYKTNKEKKNFLKVNSFI